MLTMMIIVGYPRLLEEELCLLRVSGSWRRKGDWILLIIFSAFLCTDTGV